MGSWFTARPVVTYRARWEGDLAAIQADQAADRLAARLQLEVLDDEGDGTPLRVTDPVLGRTFDVPLGGWFADRQWWTDDQVQQALQELNGDGLTPWRWSYVVTGGEPASGV